MISCVSDLNSKDIISSKICGPRSSIRVIRVDKPLKAYKDIVLSKIDRCWSLDLYNRSTIGVPNTFTTSILVGLRLVQSNTVKLG